MAEWEHRQTDDEDMLYIVMERGDTDLGKVISKHRKHRTLTLNKIRYFWEEILMVGLSINPGIDFEPSSYFSRH